MKMIMTIIHDEDAHRLMHQLMGGGFFATKLASTGGFLKTGNTTIFIGVEDEQVDQVLEIIKKECKTNKKVILASPPVSGFSENFISYPMEIVVGGATVFVVNVDQFLKF